MKLLIKPLMNTFSGIFFKKFKELTDKKKFILYKIVDSKIINAQENYKIQCINTKAVLSIAIGEIVFDLDILYGLHPVQGCYIGMEYAKISHANQKQKTNSYNYFESRYGKNNLLYQARDGRLGFESKADGRQFIMEAQEIALTEEIIEEFDAIQAFYIGILAGLKFIKEGKNSEPVQKQKPDLRLVI